VVVFGSSWLAGKMMIDSLGKLSGNFLSRWILLGGDNIHLTVTIQGRFLKCMAFHMPKNT
jgi:hypothetical protein